MPVGAHDQPALLPGQKRLIVSLVQVFVVEMLGEQLLNQLGHGTAAAAVRHVDGTAARIEAQGKAFLHHVHAAASPSAGFVRSSASVRKRP